MASTSYAPLADLEGARSERIQRRTYALSPYQSEANSPTLILKSFLESTRAKSANAIPRTKQLQLRVTVQKPGSNKAEIFLNLPELTDYDSIPFALANDTPCLRGLPRAGARSWQQTLQGFIKSLRRPDRLTIEQKLELHHYAHPSLLAERSHLQLWNTFETKAEYASPESESKLRERAEDGLAPPWRPLLDAEPQPARSTTTYVGEEEEEDGAALDLTGGDFDLSQVFTRSKRQRPASKYISNALQETIERFSDDRHFSKWLICREAVYGWDWNVIKGGIRELASKGKGREEEIDVELSLEGLEARPVFHVVWVAIPTLERIGLASHQALVGLLAWIGICLALIVLGAFSSRWKIVITTMVGIAAAVTVYLARTQTECVFDGVGTAWCLRPSWVKAEDGWYTRKGSSETDWLSQNSDRISAALQRQL